jgi:hypothetical protein
VTLPDSSIRRATERPCPELDERPGRVDGDATGGPAVPGDIDDAVLAHVHLLPEEEPGELDDAVEVTGR